MKRIALALLLGGMVVSLHAETMSGICMVWVAENKPQNAEVVLKRGECDGNHDGCGVSDNSNIAWDRWSGVSPDALKQEGAVLKARMTGDAGELVCNGSVHDGLLAGRYEFTPNEAFVKQMGVMGFDGLTPGKLEGFLLLDVSIAWVRQIKAEGVTELSTGKLMGMRALHVDPDYIHAMSAAGYPELRANKLVEMKAVGVTPQKARDARALGFQPTEQELIQMSIFKIDKPFIEKMKARGLQDLTLAKLVKIKVFKLDD